MFTDAAEADNKLRSQACNSVVAAVDADVDVDETVQCVNVNSSTLSLVSCLVCFGLLYCSDAYSVLHTIPSYCCVLAISAVVQLFVSLM